MKQNYLRLFIGAMFALNLLCAMPNEALAMNTVKGWINKVVPGTFATDQDATTDTGAGSEVSYTESEVKVLTALKDREAELEKREEAFSKRTGELKLLSQQIEQKLEQMRSLAARIETMRKERKELDEKDISRMVKYYETMSSENTAPFFNQMDRVTAMHLIMRMNPRKASAVLQLLDPKVAVDITERVTRFKENREELVVNK
ncbi:MAG: hypothetical protein A2508_09090 [Candidatus Lambdaproteobacteria bacterium RIFOXYD12_FULL_49_8]|nr:MAG: hypothetical protein A2508_09090 [Candidatus Lambdaproteobacteria bacterium RIFOXYD12_FULL_49_8]